MTMPSSNDPRPCSRAPTKNMATRASSSRVRKRALFTCPYASMSDQRTGTWWMKRLVTRQLAVGDPVRTGGLDAEPVDLVLLVRVEVALEPEPLVGVLLGALPREHVGGDPVEEHPVVGDDHGAARELEQRIFQAAQGLDVEVVGRLVE